MFAGSNVAEGDIILRAIKFRKTPSFRGKVKTSAPFRKIIRHVKKHFEVLKRYFVRQNSPLSSPVPPLLAELPESSGARIMSFPLSMLFHHGSPCSHIIWG
jgi:hypothetical protein